MTPANKGRKLPPEVLTRSELDSLIKSCDRRSFTGLRAKALIVFMWRTGLRCSEALSVRPCDLSRKQNTVRVLHGKGAKARTVGIDDSTLALIDDWIGRRKAVGVREGPLFCSRTGSPVHGSSVRRLFDMLRQRAGLSKRFHPHSLRHTFACELVREGTPVNIVQQLLGHNNLATTNTYLQGIEPLEAINAIKNRPDPNA